MNTYESPTWYDFIPLPAHVGRRTLEQWQLGHHLYAEQRHSGHFKLELEARTPVHVGSGILERSEDAGFAAGTLVKGIAKVDGQPIIPATSLKGALRSNYETITYSCLGPMKTDAVPEKYHADNYRKSELPRSLVKRLPRALRQRADRYPGRIDVVYNPAELKDFLMCKLFSDDKPGKSRYLQSKICPACALFGTEGLQGRVWFEDADVMHLRRPPEPIRLNSLYQPRRHKAGSDLQVVNVQGRTKVQVRRVRGRKVYYRVRWGDIPVDRRRSTPADCLAAGTRLTTRLYFQNVSSVELGGVIAALGIIPKADFMFPLRLGGAKPLGLGEVGIALEGIYLTHTPETWLDYEFEPKPVTEERTDPTLDPTFLDWVLAFINDKKIYYETGMRCLAEIARRNYGEEQRPWG